MAEQPGFLGTLGISPVDERDAVQAQRDALATQRQQRMQALGAQTGRGVAGLIGGAVGAARGQGFGASAQRAHASATDRDVAQQTGMTVEQLQARREIRKLTSNNDGEPSFESRSKLLREIITIANNAGDSELVGNALRQLSVIKTEEQEFKKLKGQADAESAGGTIAGLVTGYDHNKGGEAFEGTLGVDENGRGGLNTVMNGQNVFRPWSDEFSRSKPTSEKDTRLGATTSKLIQKSMSAKDFSGLRNSIVANSGVIDRYNRMLSTLTQAANDGNVQSIIGDAGGTIRWFDNKIRGFQGVLRQFSPLTTDSHKKGGDDGNEVFTSRSQRQNNRNDPFWDLIALPEHTQMDAAQAGVFKGQIMDMAYLIARAAEPSNRGLSDNDIKAALVKFGADSGNPAVMMRRAMQIILDGSREIDRRLATVYTTVDRPLKGGLSEKIPNHEIDRVMGGEGLIQYRSDVTNLFTKFGATALGSTDILIDTPLDADVNPEDDTKFLTPGDDGLPALSPEEEQDILRAAGIEVD